MSLPSLSRRERTLVVFLAALSAGAVVAYTAPVVVESPNLSQSSVVGHGFPTAPDLLTGFAVLATGMWGWRRLRRLEREHESALDSARLPQATVQPPFNALDCAWMFFAGLILMPVGSVLQELQPGGLLLQADRAGMALAFGGMVGFSVCERVSARAGWSAAWFVLCGGLVAALECGGNGMPWL
ncbi:MAG: hypothetical protein KKC79_06070, partial [Gammaproteobacteria bacterium]|nr:hypothetical protein [Gammaproteobacteria bacterium]